MQLKYGTYNQRRSLWITWKQKISTKLGEDRPPPIKMTKQLSMLFNSLEWFFLVQNITKSVKQWTDLNLGMILLQKDNCTGQRKWSLCFKGTCSPWFINFSFQIYITNDGRQFKISSQKDIVNRYTSLWIGKEVIWHTDRVCIVNMLWQPRSLLASSTSFPL